MVTGVATYNPGPSVRVINRGWGKEVVSSPAPVHRADVIRIAGSRNYGVVVRTASVQARLFPSLSKALHHAATIVGALYRVDMRSRFTGPQRFIMGRNLCPAYVPCPGGGCDRDGTEHLHLCKRVPEHLTIWCDRHGGGDTDSPPVQ